MIWRIALGLLMAAAYTIFADVFALAASFIVFGGHWEVALASIVAHTVGCLGAVITARTTISPLTGLPIRTPLPGTAFWFFGNDQDGLWVHWHRAKYPRAMRWVAPFMWAWWRNNGRNTALIPALSFLHKPRGVLRTFARQYGATHVEVHQRGWMIEVKYTRGERYGDFGPRLDQPDAWGAVSWACRPWGRG